MRTNKHSEFRDTKIVFLSQAGIKLYPVWNPNRKKWFLEVDASKRYPDIEKKKSIIRYNKEIGTKNVLRHRDFEEALEKTMDYWIKKIKDEDRKEVYRPE